MILLQELEIVFGQTHGRQRTAADGGRTDRRGSQNSYLDGDQILIRYDILCTNNIMQKFLLGNLRVLKIYVELKVSVQSYKYTDRSNYTLLLASSD